MYYSQIEKLSDILTYYSQIEKLSGILTAENIPHDVAPQLNNGGWQMFFPWCGGDVACNEMTGGYLESWRFPWDKGDVTKLPVDVMAEHIVAEYKRYSGAN